MKIFPNNAKLEAQFTDGKAPEPEAMLGPKGEPANWRVAMLTGPTPNMGGWPFCHRKEFAKLGKKICGCNVFALLGLAKLIFFPVFWLLNFDGQWGSFFLEIKDGYLLINYNMSENSWLSKRVRDHIRTTDDPGVMIGKFYWVWRGREIFLGFFILTRMKAV